MATATKKKKKKKSRKKYWSRAVTERSNAMDLQPGVFKLSSGRKIAASIKRSVTRSDRLKSTPFRSAMSMLNFYLNRGGKNLSEEQRRRLESAKVELRKMFGR